MPSIDRVTPWRAARRIAADAAAPLPAEDVPLDRAVGRVLAATVRFVLSQPAETVIPEMLVLPMRETSWP